MKGENFWLNNRELNKWKLNKSEQKRNVKFNKLEKKKKKF